MNAPLPSSAATSSIGESVAGRRVSHDRNWIISIQICSLTLAVLLVAFEPLRHWFVIPVLLSGILITKDAVDWFRNDDDSFDPVGLFGFFGFHFFFLSYLLNVAFDFWWSYPYPPSDWRPWLGYSAALNCVGLVLYRVVVAAYRKGKAQRPWKTSWRINDARFPFLILIGLIVSVIAQYIFYKSFGGVADMIEIYMSRRAGENPMQGLGFVAVFAESFPVLLTIAIAVMTRRSKLWQSPVTFGVVLFVVFLSSIYFGGLKGSRSNIFYTMVWAAGILHFWVRPISKKLVIIGPLILFVFMNTYLLYKRGGVEGIMNIGDPTVREEIMRGGIQGRPELFILLHDFARADTNALVLYMLHKADDYQYSMGRSYVGAVLSVIPRAIWPDRPEALENERSDLLFGRGADVYVPYAIGLAGEASMNFGPVAVPLSFLLIAAAILGVRRIANGVPPGDARRMLVPLLVILCFIFTMGEFESVMYAVAKNGFMPLTIIFLACDRVPNPQALLRGSGRTA